MSWSTHRTGPAADVARLVQEDISRYNCSQPEQAVKEHVGRAIAAALGGMPEGKHVTVSASGHQYPAPDDANRFVNALSVSIS